MKRRGVIALIVGIIALMIWKIAEMWGKYR